MEAFSGKDDDPSVNPFFKIYDGFLFLFLEHAGNFRFDFHVYVATIVGGGSLPLEIPEYLETDGFFRFQIAPAFAIVAGFGQESTQILPGSLPRHFAISREEPRSDSA